LTGSKSFKVRRERRIKRVKEAIREYLVDLMKRLSARKPVREIREVREKMMSQWKGGIKMIIPAIVKSKKSIATGIMIYYNS